jgi:mannan endo-1,4-beta-mannosidase
MKRYNLLTVFLMMLSLVSTGCAAATTQEKNDNVEEPTVPPAKQLYSRLQHVVDSGKFIFGHHDDTAYGHTWKYEADRSDVKDVVGDYPGLMNWDLGLIEYRSEKQLDGVPFDFIRNEVKKQHARGGINSFSWHLRNPATGGDSWDTSATNVHDVVTPGTALNDTIKRWASYAADFFLSLKDDHGNHIPVLFRPWHEHTGSWFWWGRDFCTPDEYKALWRIVRTIFDKKGVDNVLWVYSPDKVADEADYRERYPGDEYVDILGADVYHFSAGEGLEDYFKRAHIQLNAATHMSQLTGKLIALSETGSESLPMPRWWTKVLLPLCSEYHIAYVCVWRNAYQEENPTHFYAPFPGQESENSFIQFYNNPKTLFAKDLKEIK